MVKGGYQIINFNSVEFKKQTPMQLSNIYDKIEGTDKAILLSGLNVNGVDYRDVMCTPIVIGDSYVIKVFGFRIYISDIDIVTVEDEIYYFGEDVDISFGSELSVSDIVYNRLLECLDGNFRAFKIKNGDYNTIFTITASIPEQNILYSVFDNSIKTITLNGDNLITIV